MQQSIGKALRVEISSRVPVSPGLPLWLLQAV
jgi:hypothetical protein